MTHFPDHTMILCSCNGVMRWECEECEYVEPISTDVQQQVTFMEVWA